MPRLKVLILGGTTEGRELAAACAGRFMTVSSLAGRTGSPIIPAGELRIGGFGGPGGLADYLRASRIQAVVDATHPFAATMTEHAAAATAAVGVPLLVLRRPGWIEQPGDDWQRVATVGAAAAALKPGRVFLTTGRQEIGAFAGRYDCSFLARSVEPPVPPMPLNLEVLIDRGPFTVGGEKRLLAGMDVLVTKDSGGADAKLVAARELSVPVIMIDRPAIPAVPTVASVGDAIRWLNTIDLLV